MEQKFVIQKIGGYEDQYLLLGGPSPQVISKKMVMQNIANLNNQIDLQKAIVAKIEQMQKSEVSSKESDTLKQKFIPETK